MSRGLFDEDPFGALFVGLLGLPAPPDSVPLRLLGLDAIPATRDAVKAAFRSRVMAAHPDLAAYTIPTIRGAAEAAVALEPDVQELVWARDLLLRKIRDPVTGNNVGARYRFRRNACPGCGTDDDHDRWGWVRYGRWAGYHRRCAEDAEHARQRDLRRQRRAGRICAGCGATFTPKRADGRYCSGKCRQFVYRQRRAEP